MNEPDTYIRQEDFDHLEEMIQDYLEGRIDSNRLVSERLLLGVYGQRQEGLCMVRTKLPGGRLAPRQLLGFADGLEQFSNSDVVHLSTRQNIQYHNVPLEQTPELLRLLSRSGIGGREACGNTVRNVTSCPLAGVCPREHVDIMPHIDATARYFLRNPLTQSMPRKFKISFSACEADCAMGMIHDVGVMASRMNGKSGFRLLAGGGLGAKPHEAIELEEFIGEERLLPAIEAVIALHDKYSDRTRKAHSRIKFLVERFGADGFIEKYREELERTLAAFDVEKTPRGEWREAQEGPICGRGAPREVFAQHQGDLHVVPIGVPGGDLNAEQLRGLCQLLEREGYSDLRIAQDQNLMVFNVPAEGIETLLKGLEALSLSTPEAGSDVVACPGTSTCKLGITTSRLMAPTLSGGSEDLSIRVNGCQNNCAHSNIADIGFYGKGRRHFGKLVPTYGICLGGSGLAGGSLAFAGPEVPAARVPAAVKRIHDAYKEGHAEGEDFSTWSRSRDAGYFDDLLQDLVQVREFELSTLQRDHGDSVVFNVQSVGVGECAGAQTDPLDKLLLDIAYERNLRNAFAVKRKFEEAADSLSTIFSLTEQALLTAAGAGDPLPPEDERGAVLTKTLASEGEVVEEFAALNKALKEWQETQDELAYPVLTERADAWLQDARLLCRTLKAQREKERKAAQQVA